MVRLGFFFIISYVGNGKFSLRASIEMLDVAHLGSSTYTTRNSQTAAKRERAVAAQECVYGNVTLPPPSFIVLHGWLATAGSAFRYMDCRAFTYATYAIRSRVRPADPRERGKIDERARIRVWRVTRVNRARSRGPPALSSATFPSPPLMPERAK